ncbi:MAG: FtsW/RodA/SpoVE family cell cycle protein [Clostridia bacterium]|nr:FtsW/RodA/SpoVE family cell cycle protein [Clostridia bacterium]
MPVGVKNYFRKIERKLLILVSIYTLLGAGVLYMLGLAPSLNVIIIGALITVFTFWALNYYWSLMDYRGDPFLFPLVALFASTSLIFLCRLNPIYAARQFVWLMGGLLVLLTMTRLLTNYWVLAHYKYIYALAGIVGLVLPIFFGVEQGGAKSWLDLGFFSLQTSEFVKILLVLFLASFLTENRLLLTEGTRTVMGVGLPTIREWGPLVIMWGVSLILLIFQKDLGTGLIYFSTFLFIVYASTGRASYVLIGGLMFLTGAGASYSFFHHVRMRVEIWLDPWQHIETYGYQVAQSLFAIAAGGIAGAGIGAGLPRYIPAVHTDFIFAAITEELGLAGGIALIIMYIIFVYRGFVIALQAGDDFSSLLAVGITSLMGLQSFIILAGVTKMLPLTGVTLPFISYGGSSLVANFIILALLLNISHANNTIREERPAPALESELQAV